MKTLKKFEQFIQESVGDYEDSFIDVNIDETELEDSDRPNLGKLKQKTGKIIIETPSKTDAYNAKMRLGGDIIQEPGSDKQIHHVKSVKESIDPTLEAEISNLNIKLEESPNFPEKLVLTVGNSKYLMDKQGKFYTHKPDVYTNKTDQLSQEERTNFKIAVNKIKEFYNN